RPRHPCRWLSIPVFATAESSAASSCCSKRSAAVLPGDRLSFGTDKKKRRGVPAALKLGKCSIYFDTDFLNIRSIFSLIASMAVEFDCEVDNAWFAVLCAPEAADCALEAALLAAAASLDAF